MTVLRYAGEDAGGVYRMGAREVDDPRAVLAEFWPRGWRSLDVTHDGRVVARIGKRKGRRVWWAEAWMPTPYMSDEAPVSDTGADGS